MWRPLITNSDERARISSIVREIAETLASASLDVLRVAPHCDQLLLQAYVEEAYDASADHLGVALRAQSRSPQALGLHDGLANIGWTIAHLASDANALELCATIDAILLRALDGEWRGGYDLISGVVGFGVYALERGEAGKVLATRALEVLGMSAERRRAGLAWKTPPRLLPRHQIEIAPEGYTNLGIAHGVPGIVAFCARCVDADIEPMRARELMNGAVEFLLDAEPPNERGRFPAWHTDREASGDRARLAWCYGDLGVAAALLAAARVEPRWLNDALSLAHACALRPRGAGVRDASVCHGAAGIAHIFNRMRHATGDSIFRDAALRWLHVTLEMRTERGCAGFAAFDGVTRDWRADPSVMLGAAGVALVLSSMLSDREPLWDRMLLLDLSC